LSKETSRVISGQVLEQDEIFQAVEIGR
jgi:hypothetical protein